MSGWVERGWTDDEGNRWVTTADGARMLGPSPFLPPGHGDTMTIRQHVNDLRQRLANRIAPPRTYEVAINDGRIGEIPLARVVSRNGPPVIGAGNIHTIREIHPAKRPLWRRWKLWATAAAQTGGVILGSLLYRWLAS